MDTQEAIRLNTLAVELANSGKLQEALQHLVRAIQVAPREAAVVANMLRLLHAIGRDDLACELFDGFESQGGEKVKLLSLLDHGLLAFIDPTEIPPPSFLSSKARADLVYGEAFRRCAEYCKYTKVEGDCLEFGTFRGYTARLTAILIAELELGGRLHLFDSFEGLPEMHSSVDQKSYEVVNKVWFAGEMRVTPLLPALIERSLSRIIGRERLNIVKGFYADTLDCHLPDTKAALVHVDCDLYSSTRTVLEKLLEKDILQDGTVILFDDYNCSHANPSMGERRALREVIGGQSRFSVSPWFSYGWAGQVFFVHDAKCIVS